MSENRTHISDQKWDQVLKAMSRREFILSVAATGVLTLIPRFVSAAAGDSVAASSAGIIKNQAG